MDKSNSVEALAYPDIIAFSNDLDDSDKFLNTGCVQVAIDHGYTQGDIDGTTQDRATKFYQTDSSIVLLQNEMEESPEKYEELAPQLDAVTSDMDRLTSDPIPTLSSLVSDRADVIESMCKRLNTVITVDPVNSLGGDQDAEALVLASIESASESAEEIVEEIRAGIRTIRTIIRIADKMNKISSMSLSDIIQNICGQVIANTMNSLLTQVSSLKATLVEPAMQFVGKLQKNADKTFGKTRNIDKLAHIIMDVIENISARFDDFILDFYRGTVSRKSAFSTKLDNISDCKWLDSAEKILDEIESALSVVNAEKIMQAKAAFVDDIIDRVKTKYTSNKKSASTTSDTNSNNTSSGG
jgi:hypothetical protein